MAHKTTPILMIRNSVLFPSMVMPITAGRDRSVAAVEAALESDSRQIAVFTQIDPTVEEPGPDDIYTIGTLATITKASRSQNGYQLVLQGQERVRLVKFESVLQGRLQTLPMADEESPVIEALRRDVLDLGGQFLALIGQTPREGAQALIEQLSSQFTDPIQLAYFVAGSIKLDIPKEIAILEANSRLEALQLVHKYMVHELEVQRVRKEISSQAKSEVDKDQREYLLRQQLRAIQKELGDNDSELDGLREKLEKADLPEDVRKEAERELTRLERMNQASPDYSVTRTYLELICELPWNLVTEDHHDVGRARQVLDDDHFGLKDVKERILEHLAVMKLNKGARAPILLLVGPPGVGKTSLGKSIATALGRKFERMSLGGLHDEAELRGHRRTYVGAMPGRLIQAVRRAGSKNPVLMLDEVDKLGSSYRGDPASALLEIIDPAQNDTFRDNYLDQPFDLSKALFILTANTTSTIPRPLLDRMEVIRLSGYSEEEKEQIARRHLLPRLLKEIGLDALDLPVGYLISRYTREAGVRELERVLARLIRKVALRVAEDGEAPAVTEELASEWLGPERFQQESARKSFGPGVATGLAWTETGGDVLYVESLYLPEGKGLTLTGQLGDVMKESAQAAQSYVLSRAPILGCVAREAGVHVHVPAGAIPKDGPSAGITMAVSLASAYTRVPVRSDVAMTGELTLTGLVLPVGGIKEKVLAARRAGIRTVILPKDNRKDVRDLPDDMEYHFVEHLDQVLEIALPDLKLQVEVAASRN